MALSEYIEQKKKAVFAALFLRSMKMLFVPPFRQEDFEKVGAETCFNCVELLSFSIAFVERF